MKFIDEYRDAELSKKLVNRIEQLSTRQARLMEFCGGHTMAIMRNGLRQLLPPTVEMLSGPGCPVCVTANADIDKAIALARLPDVIITTFGDMMKVPGSYSSYSRSGPKKLISALSTPPRMLFKSPGKIPKSQLSLSALASKLLPPPSLLQFSRLRKKKSKTSMPSAC